MNFDRKELSNTQLLDLYKRLLKPRLIEEKMLILGGPEIATLFLKEYLIDEIWLTIEPKIFGEGGNFAMGEKLDIELKLLSCTRLNENGTLVLKYKVVKEIQ